MALDRNTGQQVWQTASQGLGFRKRRPADGTVLASCYGEIFCLEPGSRRGKWHNPLQRFGTGLATIATDNVSVLGGPRKNERDEQAAAYSGTTAACA